MELADRKMLLIRNIFSIARESVNERLAASRPATRSRKGVVRPGEKLLGQKSRRNVTPRGELRPTRRGEAKAQPDGASRA